MKWKAQKRQDTAQEIRSSPMTHFWPLFLKYVCMMWQTRTRMNKNEHADFATQFPSKHKTTRKKALNLNDSRLFNWWTLTVSNRWPSARQADALPTELSVHLFAARIIISGLPCNVNNKNKNFLKFVKIKSSRLSNSSRRLNIIIPAINHTAIYLYVVPLFHSSFILISVPVKIVCSCIYDCQDVVFLFRRTTEQDAPEYRIDKIDRVG